MSGDRDDDFSGSKSVKSSSGAVPAEEARSYLLRGSFWREGGGFPQIGPGKIFLAEALQRIGERRFNWDGDEVFVTNADAATLASKRLFSALAALSDAGRAGDLPTFLWRRGSKVRIAAADMWYGADPLPFFSLCILGSAWDQWLIFVDIAAVERIAAIPSGAERVVDDEGSREGLGLPAPTSGKGLELLRAFHKRLQEGKTRPGSGEEMAAIQGGWPDKVAPSEDTWRRTGRHYHRRLTWPDNKPALPADVLAFLQRVTGI